MIRTVNRQPLSVATPSDKNIREYSTNQMEWKGLNDDKNFVTVDQNSYQDCKNVYVDSEGLLRSRPSIKALNDSPSNVLDYYVFANCVAYKYHNKADDKEYIYFVQHGVSKTQLLDYGTSNYHKIQLVEADNKIFVFTINHLYVYNTDTSQITDATNDIYIPETEIYSDGVKTDSGESPNLLTDSYYKTYIYTGIGEPNYALFIGENIKVKLDNTEYDITNFKRDQELTFLHKIASINNDSIEQEDTFTPMGTLDKKHAYISISSIGSMIISSYTNLSNDTTPNLVWTIYYSSNGKTYEKLPYLADILSEPKLSEDGAYVFCFTKTGLQVISVLSNYYDVTMNDYRKKYPVWELLDTLSDINNLPTEDIHLDYRQNIVINGYFIDDENYSYIYAFDSRNVQSDYPQYQQLKLCIRYNDSFSSEIISEDILDNQYVGHYRPNIICKKSSKFEILLSITSNRYSNSSVANETWYFVSTDAYSPVLKAGITITNNSILYLGDNYEAIFYVVNTESGSELWGKVIASDQGSTPGFHHVSGISNASIGNDVPYLYTDKGLYVLKNDGDIENFLTDESFRNSVLRSFEGFGYDDLIPLQFYNNVSYYLHGTDILSTTNELTVKELVSGTINYVVPDKVSKLENYFMSFGNKTYISKIVSTDFKWYLPLDSENKYESDVTNLHPISSTEMAIFLKDAIYYTVWDSDLGTYRYFKSKIQVGCRPDCDVITTFDGKYVIFTSERGLVAMNYQDFVATTDQSLTYISDTIYQVFYDYMTEHSAVSGQVDAIQLYKYAYWIIVYKNNSSKGLVFDLRNNTWWPFESFKPIVKIVTENDKPKLLIGRSLYKLDIADTNYYDYDGNKHNISWFILSQKMYLGALNYYKHIVNITFNSVHDVTLLNNSDYNINELVFKLQVNNYRKTLNGNVDTREHESVNYIVNSAKTVIQRLNYSKVHEFQYKISNSDSAFRLPLSLTAMSVKYKVGGQIR